VSAEQPHSWQDILNLAGTDSTVYSVLRLCEAGGVTSREATLRLVVEALVRQAKEAVLIETVIGLVEQIKESQRRLGEELSSRLLLNER